MKIEFGCGATPTKKDFLTCDIRELPGIDYVCPAWEISEHVASGSIAEIFSRHFLEHLTFVQAEKLVNVWYKILKPSGVCELLVPNMDFHINQWIHAFQNGINTDKDKNKLKHACAGFWGHQREGEYQVWDVHKSGYNQHTLTELFVNAGFVDAINHRKNTNKHLHMSFTKPADD